MQNKYALPDGSDDEIPDDYQVDESQNQDQGYSIDDNDEQPIDDDDEDDVENLDRNRPQHDVYEEEEPSLNDTERADKHSFARGALQGAANNVATTGITYN